MTMRSIAIVFVLCIVSVESNLLAKFLKRTPPSVAPSFNYDLINMLDSNDEAQLSDVYSSINVVKTGSVSGKELSGCWQVADFDLEKDTRDQPNWRKYSNVLGKLSSLFPNFPAPRNFQYFSEEGNTFNNLSEYLGPSCYVMTEGTYKTTGTPQVVAYVTTVCVYIFGLSLRINVDGKGLINVKYIDRFKRVLENEDGARVLQIKIPVPAEYRTVLLPHDM